MALESWSVTARNLPEHADNVVHTDEGARAAGYPSALVAGTTVHAYLTRVPATAWGEAWLTGGASEVRFLSPVFEADVVECAPTPTADRVEARVGHSVRATLALLGPSEPDGRVAGEPAAGEELPPMVVEFDDDLAGYGARSGDDLGVYAELGLVHPVVWSVIGNRVTMANLVTGPWVHVRSRIRHLGRAAPGAAALVESSVVDRFDTRAGGRVVLDVRVSIDGVAVAAIEHESIIDLRTGA